MPAYDGSAPTALIPARRRGQRINPTKRGKRAQPATLIDLDGKLFHSVPAVALIFGRDERTIRDAIARGEIPATRVGRQWHVPTSWIREQAGAA